MMGTVFKDCLSVDLNRVTSRRLFIRNRKGFARYFFESCDLASVRRLAGRLQPHPKDPVFRSAP